MTRPDVADIRRAAIEGGALEVNGSLTAKAMLAACDWIAELEAQRAELLAAFERIRVLPSQYHAGHDAANVAVEIARDTILKFAESAKRNQGSAV